MPALRLRLPPAHRPAERAPARSRRFVVELFAEQRLAPGTSLTDLPGPPLGRPLSFRKLPDERVARLLQLLDPSHVRLGKASRGRHVGGKIARVGSQLDLQPGDLAAQLV